MLRLRGDPLRAPTLPHTCQHPQSRRLDDVEVLDVRLDLVADLIGHVSKQQLVTESNLRGVKWCTGKVTARQRQGCRGEEGLLPRLQK